MRFSFHKTIATTLICSSLTACGGGESNVAPTISVANVSVKERALVTVPATITDTDGSVSKISWAQKSGVTAALADTTSATLTFKAPDVTKDETLQFIVTVTDNAGAMSSKEVSVVVKNNLLPSLDVANSTVAERKRVELQANAVDSDGSIVNYVWTQKSGTVATLTSTSSNTLNFIAPTVQQDETLVLNVKVIDDTGESVDKDIQVLVINNRPPAIDASNVSTRERAATQLQMKATDVDGSVVSYSWVQKSGTKATLASSNGETLSFNAPVISQDEVLVFTATATDDSGESGSKDVQVSVQNNLGPTIAVSNANARERAAVTLTAVATDGDGTIAGYKWTQKSGVAATLTNTNAATLSFSAPTVTSNEVLIFNVEVTDNEGEVSSKDVTLNVTNNNAPMIAISDFAIKEHMPVSISPTIEDADGDSFKVVWTQRSGLVINNPTLSGNMFNFVAPDITKDEVLVFTVTATDTLGDVSTKDVTVTLRANVEKLTFNGSANSATTTSQYYMVRPTITIQVGSSSNTVQADNGGYYTLEVVVDEKDYNQQVHVTAVAESPKYIKLTSLVGDFQDVLAAAGDDKYATIQEVRGLWVNEVTTALDSLLQLANNNQPITSKEQYQAAQLAYDGSKLLDVALAIKLICEYPQPYPGLIPPAGFGDTAAMSRDLPKVAKYLANARAVLPDVVKKARASLVNEKVYAERDVNKITGGYWLQQVDELSAEGEFINLGNNGGKFINSQVSSDTHWLVQTGDVTVDYYPTIAGKDLVQLSTKTVTINGSSVQEVTYLKSTLINFVDISDKAATLLVQHTYVKKYPNTQIADVTVVDDFVARKGLKVAAMHSALDVISIGATYSLPMPTATDTIVQSHPSASNYQRNDVSLKILSASAAELSRISLNGTGQVIKETVNSSYTIDGSGVLSIKPQGNIFPSNINVFVWNKEAPTRVTVLTGSAVISGVLVQQNTAWTTNSVPGIYDFGTSFATPNNYGWVEFNADGTALFVSTFDYNSDGMLANNEFRLVRGLWQVRNDGSLVVRRYRNPADFCTSAVWDTAITDICTLNEERVWSPYQQAGNTYVLNLLRYTYLEYWARQSLQAPWNSATNITKDAESLNRPYTKVQTRPIAVPAGLLSNIQGQQPQNDSEAMEIPYEQYKEAARELHFD